MATIYQRKEGSVWWCSFSINGKRFRESTGERTRRSAQKIADLREEEERLRLAYDGSVSLLDACARFFTIKQLKPRTVEEYKSAATRLVAFFGDRSLSLITGEELGSYVMHRQLEGAKVSPKRELAFLSSVYSLAKTWPDGPKASPFNQFSMRNLYNGEQRTTWLTEAEIEKLLAACRQPYQTLFVLLAVDTGMRSREIRNLRVRELNLTDGLIYLGNRDTDRTKRGVGRIVPLTKRCIDTLRVTVEKGRSDWIFENPTTGLPYTTLKTFWKRAKRDAGLEDVRIHDLRHTYCSRGIQAGIDVPTMMNIVGHSSAQMFKRYAHPSLESMKRAVEKIESHT